MTNRGALAGEKQVPQMVPPGVIWEYAGQNLPDPQIYGVWLWADGSAYPRGQYAALFKEIGTWFGAGDGNTTFNVPDRRGRVGVGAGPGTGGGTIGGPGAAPSGGSALTNRSVGGWMGEETHALTSAEMTNHDHGLASHDHGLALHNHGGTTSETGHNHGHNHGLKDHNHGGGTGIHAHNISVAKVRTGVGATTHSHNNNSTGEVSASPADAGNGSNFGANLAVGTDSQGVGNSQQGADDATASTGHTHPLTTAQGSSAGAAATTSTAHNVVQPSLVCNYIVKA